MYILKFSISSRQPEDYLNKADEMFIHWKDHDLIYDLYHLAPKAIIMRIPANQEMYREDWEKVIEYRDALGENFRVALYTTKQGIVAKNLKVPFYFEVPINYFPTLNLWIKEFGVTEFIPGATLAHNMDALRGKHIPIRVIANSHMMPQFDPEKKVADGTVGAWIRPEDLWKSYEKYISYVQFDTPAEPTRDDLIREQALYRIYVEQKTWPGDIDMLVTDLNHKGTNRLIVDGFGQRRANCRQMCEVNGNCHFCYRALDLANPDLLRKAVRPQG